MSRRAPIFVLLLCVVALGVTACGRNLVRAAPPSVAASPPPEPVPPPTVPVTSAEAASAQPPAVEPTPESTPAIKPVQPRPRPPAEAEAPKPKADPEPAPPQIAPELSPQQLTAAQRRTSNDIVIAERNLQLAGGKQLNATQNDLVEKVRGFLDQAHGAIRTSDWVRAENLAHKAQILSSELIKSL